MSLVNFKLAAPVEGGTGAAAGGFFAAWVHPPPLAPLAPPGPIGFVPMASAGHPRASASSLADASPPSSPLSRSLARTLAPAPMEEATPEREGKMQKRPAGEEPTSAEIWSNAAVCAASSAAEPLMGLVDSFFVGGLGVGPVAALGCNTVIFNLISFFASCSLSTATTDRIATARASGHLAGALSSLAVAVRIALASGVVVTLALLAFPNSLLRAAGANDEMESDAHAFLALRLLAIPAGMFLVVAEGAYRALLELRVPFVCIAGLNAANAFLNPYLIYRMGLGLRGSALATTLAQWCGAAAFAHYLLRDGAKFGLPRGSGGATSQLRTLFVGRVVRPGEWGDMTRQCLLFLLRASFINIVYTVSGACANKLGTAPAAGHQVLRQVCTMTVCATWAFQAVGQSIVANAYSASGDGRARARRSARKVIRFGSFTAVALAVLSYMGRDVWPAWFLPSPAKGDPSAAAALAEARGAILPLAAFIASSANNAYEGVLLGAGDVRFCALCFAPACAACITTLFFRLHVAAGTASLGDIWTGLTAYYATLLVLFAARFHLRWMRGPLLVGATRSASDHRDTEHGRPAAKSAV